MSERDKNGSMMRLVGESKAVSKRDEEDPRPTNINYDIHDCDVTINVGMPTNTLDRIMMVLDQLIDRTEKDS